MLFTGRPITARRACELGLINRVVPAGELSAAVADLFESIAAASPLVTRIGKAAFYDQLLLDERAAYDRATDIMADNATRRDAQEGMSAFLAKRPPNWTGEQAAGTRSALRLGLSWAALSGAARCAAGIIWLAVGAARCADGIAGLGGWRSALRWFLPLPQDDRYCFVPQTTISQSVTAFRPKQVVARFFCEKHQILSARWRPLLSSREANASTSSLLCEIPRRARCRVVMFIRPVAPTRLR